MKSNLFINFLNSKNKENREALNLIDLLNFDLNSSFYFYGNHFKNPKEKFRQFLNFKWIFIFEFIFYLIVVCRSLFFKNKNKKYIFSSAYFDLNKIVGNDSFELLSCPWVINKSQRFFNIKFFFMTLRIKKLINGNVNQILNERTFDLFLKYRQELKEYVIKNNIVALFLPQDIGFFEKLSIQVFKDLNRPSFNFIHGLPGIYNNIDYNRTDFLVVWGEEIKNNFINAGFCGDKILVNGHPKYNLLLKENLRFSFNNVLVLTKSLNGSQFSNELVISDRSSTIFYLYSIQSVLQKIGIKKVRLRTHPSENIEWYYKYIDPLFFEPDIDTLNDSLNLSSLIIGGTSTIFLESLIHGVNYVVYEPQLEDGKLIDGFAPVPPFDNLNFKVPIAKTETELHEILSKNIKVDKSIIDDYISTSFNKEEIYSKISSWYNRETTN